MKMGTVSGLLTRSAVYAPSVRRSPWAKLGTSAMSYTKASPVAPRATMLPVTTPVTAAFRRPVSAVMGGGEVS